MTAVKEIPHGTASGYRYHKCRCDECREAQSEYRKAYYREASRDRELAQRKAYYEANRDRELAQKKAYREANRDRVLAQARAYREGSRDRVLAKKKAHYEANRDRALAQKKAYREANRDRVLAKQREWQKRNPESVRAAKSRRRAKKLAAPSAPYTAQQVKQRWAVWGNRCWLNPSHPAEATDHVKPLAAGGADMLANFRPICHSCNASKGAKWPLDLSSTALQRDTATAVSTNNPKKGNR